MSRTQYTWQDVMLNFDVLNEGEKERKQQQDILDEQVAEDKASALWSLGLSLVGGALFGPVGYAAGKIAGRGIGDITHDWEDMAVDAGKFYKKEAAEFKRTRDKAATDQTSGQILQGVTDLAMMYVQAGGLQEGPTDLTTFGSGRVEGGELSLRGKGTPGQAGFQLPVSEAEGVTSFIDMPAVPASEDYVPSLFSEWGKDKGLVTNLQSSVKKVQGAAASGQGTKSILNKYFEMSKDI